MLKIRLKSKKIIFLFTMFSLWVLGATEWIDDGTTGEGLSEITSLQYKGSADPFVDGCLLLKTSQGAKIVWYDASVKLPASYIISCTIKPKGNQSRCRVGLMGWLDVQAKTGLAVYIKPSASFCVRFYDFTSSGDPESTKHLFQSDGNHLNDISAKGYDPTKWAIIAMHFIPVKNKKMTARCDVTITQGKKHWRTTFFTDLPIPPPNNHRFGYWASYAGKTLTSASAGYVDNLALHTSKSFVQEKSEEIPVMMDQKSRPTIAKLTTEKYRVEFFDHPFGFNVIKAADNTILLKHPQTFFYSSGVPHTADRVTSIQKTATRFEADLSLDGFDQPAHILVLITPKGLLKIQLNGPENKIEKIREVFRDQGEEYYGVWEYAFNKKLSNRGAEYDLIGVKPGAHGMHSTNARAPFYMTSRGYGIYVDTLRLGQYSFAKRGQTRFEFEGSTLSWYFIFGDDYTALMYQHNQLAGSAFVPPDWALGTAWWRDDEYRHMGKKDLVLNREISNAEDNVKATANNLQHYKIPASVIWIDRPFGSIKNTSGSTKGWGNMDFDSQEKGFPNARSMIDTIRKQGYELQIWIANRCNGQLKEEAKANAYIFTHNNLPDPAADVRIPAAYIWFQNKLDLYAKMGIKGYKIDRGHPQTETPRKLENENVYLFTKLAAEGQRKRWGNDSFVFARNAFNKSRAYVGIWNGDLPGNYKGLQDSIRDGLRCGAINFPIFGSDTPGLAGGRPSADLFARWIQFSTYCTWMEINIGNTSSDRTIWDSNLYPKWLLDVVRKQCQTRFDLIPYTRSALYQATQTGIPVMQALIFAYPNDPTLVNKWDEYLYGSALLVAPITSADTTNRTVYLPAGKWLNYNDKSTTYAGSTTIKVAAPKDSIPRFVKAGGIIPCGHILKANNNWTKNWTPRLRIECFPAAGITQTFDYFNKTNGIPITLSTTMDGILTLQFAPLGTPGFIEIYCRHPGSILKNGKSLVAGKDYRWNAAEHKLQIPFSGKTKLVIKQLHDLFNSKKTGNHP